MSDMTSGGMGAGDADGADMDPMMDESSDESMGGGGMMGADDMEDDDDMMVDEEVEGDDSLGDRMR